MAPSFAQNHAVCILRNDFLTSRRLTLNLAPVPSSKSSAVARPGSSRLQVSESSRSSRTRVLALASDFQPPAGAGPVDPNNTRLYVGNLPFDVDSNSLAEVFQEIGSVELVQVMHDRVTGRSRGFAFVTMSSHEEAQAAIEQLDGCDVGGRNLRVSFPAPPAPREGGAPGRGRPMGARGGGRGMGMGGGGRPNNPNRLYVGNLPWTADDSSLAELFSPYGDVVDARVVIDRETGRSRGFGFVTLDSEQSIVEAMNSLDGSDIDGRTIRVGKATDKA